MGGRDEAVRGVRVKSLKQLHRTKSFDKKTSLLEFLEAQLVAQAPEACAIRGQLTTIKSASRISMNTVVGNTHSLSQVIPL